MDEPEAKHVSYGYVLDKVGQYLTKDNVEALATIAELTISQKGEVMSREGNGSRFLFNILEEREIISRHNVGWLQRNLRGIKNELAAKIIDDFIGTETEFELPSEPEYSEGEDEDDETNTFEYFLEKVGLKDKYPGKLKLKSFLQLGTNEQKNYVHTFWQKLTSLNYRAGILQELVTQDYSMRDFIFCVLHCCNDFLRQDILEKMSACQLAVPVVLQSVSNSKPLFLLWALRRVMKKWRGETDSFAIEQPIVSYPVLNISVIRIGDVRISKSQFLNTMLSYSQGYSSHTFFLNREKDFVVPRFSPGSVECVWFLPMWESENQIFKQVIAFFNLRGDCTKYPEQTTFACKAAHLTIALIATSKHKYYKEHVSQIRKNSKSMLFISVSEEESHATASQKVHRPKYKGGCYFVNVVQMDILSKTICEEIVRMCKIANAAKTRLESLTNICGENIQIDEQDEHCRKGRQAVCDIFEQGKALKNLNVLDFKKSSFPLQAVWKDWVEIDKASLHVETEVHESFEHQMESKTLRKIEKRNAQLQTNLSPTMEVYLRIMKCAKPNSVLLQYILGFMQEKIYHMVNENTRNNMNDIAELEREIRQIRDQMMPGSERNDNGSKSDKKGKSKVRNESTYKVKTDACNKLYTNCRAQHLGGEHFLRELGQLYEACMDLQETQIYQSEAASTSNVALLPSLAAHLVTEMQSLEIMDGDTGCVPLTWVTSVLDTLTMELKDPKVLVISVIGVQSSGKSTLLNSMFGVKFPVRAGRCTRGLFIQLVKLSDGLSKELGFHYLVVVDSEGIRSIDHDDRRFDNELVTLALSIANVTIFNIGGENIGPDMMGILQIAAHALMRMKEVDLTCHCRIVQQCVSDMTAADRNKANTKTIKDTLDEATRFAAEEEGLEGRYRHFSDVVELQVDEDLQYVPCLWAGGMAPPNHMYSETVTKIKVKLFEDIKKGSIVPELTLSTFTERVRDVWKAVKEEGFIFNFHDSVKAVDFNQLCLEYNQWIAQMRQEVHITVSKIVSSVQMDPERERLQPDIRTSRESLETEIEDQRCKLTKCIEDYIARHPRKNMMLKHRQEFLHDINVVLSEIKAHSLTKLSDDYDVKKISLNLPHFQKKSRLIVALEVKVNQSKVRHMSDVLRLEYCSELWQKCVEKIKKENNITRVTVTPSSLQHVCERLLLKVTRDMAVGSEIHALLSQEGGITNHVSIGDCSKYISVKFVKSWLRHDSASKVGTSTGTIPVKDDIQDIVGSELQFKYNDMLIPQQSMLKQQLSQLMTGIGENIPFKDEEQLMEDKRKQAVDYLKHIVDQTLFQMQLQSKAFDANIFQLMLQKTLKKLSTKDENFNIKLPHRLIAKGLLHFCGRVLRHVYYRGANEIENLLDFDKNEMNATVESYIVPLDQHEVAANFLCYYAEKIFIHKVATFCDDFYDKIDYRKYTQLVHVPWDILHLWLKNKTHDFVVPVVDIDASLSVFVDAFLHIEGKICGDKINAGRRSAVDSFILNLTSTIGHVQSQDTTWKDWCNNLGDSLGCTYIKAAGDLFEVSDVAQVSKLLTDKLNNILHDKCLQDYDRFDNSLFKNAAGLSHVCNEVCPMCGVFCDNILESHTVHSSSLHRPLGFKNNIFPRCYNLCSQMTNAYTSFTLNASNSAFSGSAAENKAKLYSGKLVLENCNTSILSDTATFIHDGQTYLCKNFKVTFPNWEIHPGRNNEPGKLFWQWFFTRLYGHFTEVPQSWSNITKEHALQSLEKAKYAHLHGRQSMVSMPLKKRLLASFSQDP